MASTAGDHREEHRPARAGRPGFGRGLRRRPQRERGDRQRRELIAYAKANPGKLRFGSSGIGAASHLSGELFKAQANVDMQHVPYKGTGQALTDLLGGQIEVMFAPTQTVIPQLQSGRLKAIAVTGTAAARRAAEPADRRRLGTARLSGAGLVRPARSEGDAAGGHRQAARRRRQGARAARRSQGPDRQGRGAGRAELGRVRPLHRRRAGQVGQAGEGCRHRDGVSRRTSISAARRPPPCRRRARRRCRRRAGIDAQQMALHGRADVHLQLAIADRPASRARPTAARGDARRRGRR